MWVSIYRHFWGKQTLGLLSPQFFFTYFTNDTKANHFVKSVRKRVREREWGRTLFGTSFLHFTKVILGFFFFCSWNLIAILIWMMFKCFSEIHHKPSKARNWIKILYMHKSKPISTAAWSPSRQQIKNTPLFTRALRFQRTFPTNGLQISVPFPKVSHVTHYSFQSQTIWWLFHAFSK